MEMQITRTYDAITLSKGLMSNVDATVSSQRGYFLTSDPAFLDSYEGSKENLNEYLTSLKILTKEQEGQNARVEELGYRLNNFITLLDNAISTKKPVPKIFKLDDYESIVDLRNDIVRMNETILKDEYDMLNTRIKSLEAQQNQYKAIIISGSVFAGILLFIFTAYLLRTQLRLLKASQAKSQFLAHMSHEIRTPLTAITGAAEILESRKEQFDERLRRLVGVIHSSSISLKDLVTDVLDFSKIESQEIDLNMEYHNLAGLLQQVISIMSVRANEKGIKFNVKNELSQNTLLYMDKIRLRQILINLVGNAVKFTDKGKVSITVEERDNMIAFMVQDTGIGIEKKHQKQIFKEFKQARSSTSKNYGGSGLGLSISSRLAELMGGGLSVESDYGVGSTFTLHIPKELQYEAVSDTDKAAMPRIKKTKNRILVAEDYEGNIAVIENILEEAGVKYDIVTSGEEAVAAWGSQEYIAILMDVQMPILDGITATERIRKSEAKNGYPRTPIIGMTAHAMVEDKEKCLKAGMDNFLTKPLDSEDFIKTISQYMHKEKDAA